MGLCSVSSGLGLHFLIPTSFNFCLAIDEHLSGPLALFFLLRYACLVSLVDSFIWTSLVDAFPATFFPPSQIIVLAALIFLMVFLGLTSRPIFSFFEGVPHFSFFSDSDPVSSPDC